jgi:hypothetical protein
MLIVPSCVVAGMAIPVRLASSTCVKMDHTAGPTGLKVNAASTPPPVTGSGFMGDANRPSETLRRRRR